MNAMQSVADQPQAVRTAWWPYATAGPTGQANVGNKAARCHFPPSLARIRAPLPHFASLSPCQSKATVHHAIAAELARHHRSTIPR